MDRSRPTRLGGVLGAGIIAMAVGPPTAVQTPRPLPPMERPATTANPLVESVRGVYETMKVNVLAAAEEMPEADYGFRPATLTAPDHAAIRMFGQIVGHLSRENYLFCAAATGVAAPAGTATLDQASTKADLRKGLAASFAYCDQVWTGTTDQNAARPARYPAGFPLPATTRLGALLTSTAHDAEHYGNLVTYLRAKGLVPPSSQPHK